MARRTAPPPPPDAPERIVDVDVEEEMQGAFLEYAYSVIYSRALPDARDGLKPVQRRILFAMAEMGLRPERGHVKSSRIVGDVMGKYHPHGDTAIYDALVRLAQPFTLRLPLVDGHGNFGSLDAGPAAARYTEARMSPAALLMTAGLDEDVVDLRGTYDDSGREPAVLPAALPNLLVNGASGIAVGMATNMPPHNLVEVVGAARHLLEHPEANTEELMRFVPGPDFPTGGKVVGLEGVREAYETGRGSFRLRAAARVEAVTARRQGIVVTELPYGVGPERVVERIKEVVQSKKLQGISALTDLTDGRNGLRVVVEVKSGFVPEAVLEELYRLTPMEESFGINNVALVDGQPRTLGLRELLRVFVDHRLEVVRRRSEHRLGVAERDLHLVEGLITAVLDIDEVIQVIRAAEDAATARQRLMSVFDLSQAQAEHVLEMRLRRLTRFSVLELEQRRDALHEAIRGLREVLGDPALLRGVVSDELAAVAAEHGTPRRTVLLEAGGATATSAARASRAGRTAAPLEVADDPCWVLLSSSGLLARTATADPLPVGDAGHRSVHDVVVASVRTTARASVGAVTSRGRVLRLPALDMPSLPPTAGAPALSGGAPLAELLVLTGGERVVGLTALSPDGPGLALGTAAGVVKRVGGDAPDRRDEWEVVRLADGDEVVGAVDLVTGEEDLVLVSSDAQLLRFPASAVRPQGRTAAGMAGIRLAAGARVVFAAAVEPSSDAVVVTVAGSSAALPGTVPGSAKVAPYAEYPAKGRATGGVRAHRFLRGEDVLVLAWAGRGPARGAADGGVPVELPAPTGRRDGSGTPLAQPLVAVAGPVGRR